MTTEGPKPKDPRAAGDERANWGKRMQGNMTSVTNSMASTSRGTRWPMAGYRLAILAIGGTFVGGCGSAPLQPAPPTTTGQAVVASGLGEAGPTGEFASCAFSCCRARIRGAVEPAELWPLLVAAARGGNLKGQAELAFPHRIEWTTQSDGTAWGTDSWGAAAFLYPSHPGMSGEHGYGVAGEASGQVWCPDSGHEGLVRRLDSIAPRSIELARIQSYAECWELAIQPNKRFAKTVARDTDISGAMTASPRQVPEPVPAEVQAASCTSCTAPIGAPAIESFLLCAWLKADPTIAVWAATWRRTGSDSTRIAFGCSRMRDWPLLERPDPEKPATLYPRRYDISCSAASGTRNTAAPMP